MKSHKSVKTALAIFIIAAVLEGSVVKAADILLYDDNTVNHHAQAALNSLSLPYTVANSTTFNSLLQSRSWNLVIVDCPSVVPSNGKWTPLINYVNNNGRAIMSFWDLDNNSGAGDPGLAGAFDVSVNYDFYSPRNIYRWDAGHPVFNNPNVVGNLVSWSEGWWDDDGDALALVPLSGAQAVAGFTINPVGGEAAIVIGNNGRTIYNGFLFDQLNAPVSTNLIANEIMYVVPEPATVILLGLGSLCLLKNRRV